VIATNNSNIELFLNVMSKITNANNNSAGLTFSHSEKKMLNEINIVGNVKGNYSKNEYQVVGYYGNGGSASGNSMNILNTIQNEINDGNDDKLTSMMKGFGLGSKTTKKDANNAANNNNNNNSNIVFNDIAGLTTDNEDKLKPLVLAIPTLIHNLARHLLRQQAMPLQTRIALLQS